MIVFPNCKINFGLRILNKREDGFHNLETIFYPIPFYDALEVIRQENDSLKGISFQSTGLPIEGAIQSNLCFKAYQLLKTDFPSLPSVQMHLLKTIPLGSGLGGGSSDAAFALKLLNDKFRLGISVQQLINYALQLGSDCPFFIINKPAYATGRGEILETVELDLSVYKFAIINPHIHVKTKWAFEKLEVKSETYLSKPELLQIIKQPVSTWKDQLKNDFEEAVFNHYPEIGKIKQQLYNAGAIYASMTGSGSTVFGLFKKDQKPKLDFPTTYFLKII